MTDLLISLIKIKDRYLLVTRGVSDDAAWQELSERRRSRDKDWPRSRPCGPMRQPDIAGSWRTLNRPRQHSRRLAGNTDTR